MSQENVRSIRALYEAYNRGDVEAVQKASAKNFERIEPENSLYAAGSPYRGAEAARKGVYEQRSRDFQDWKADVEQLIDGGDYVVATGRYRARCKATGKDLATQFCHIIHLDSSGKIDRLQAFTDTLKEAEVAGRVQRIEHARMEQPVM
jgi:ketosteroid isomerase-like protein